MDQGDQGNILSGQVLVNITQVVFTCFRVEEMGAGYVGHVITNGHNAAQ